MIGHCDTRPEAELSIFHVHLKFAYRQAVIDLFKKRCDFLPFALWDFYFIMGGENILVLLFSYRAYAEKLTLFPRNQREEFRLSCCLYPQILPVLLFKSLDDCIKHLCIHCMSPFFLWHHL